MTFLTFLFLSYLLIHFLTYLLTQSLSLFLFLFLSLFFLTRKVQKVIIPNHIVVDIDSEYAIYFQRGDKIFKTTFQNIRNEDDINVIHFNESMSLSATMFLDNTGKYLVCFFSFISQLLHYTTQHSITLFQLIN